MVWLLFLYCMIIQIDCGACFFLVWYCSKHRYDIEHLNDPTIAVNNTRNLTSDYCWLMIIVLITIIIWKRLPAYVCITHIVIPLEQPERSHTYVTHFPYCTLRMPSTNAPEFHIHWIGMTTQIQQALFYCNKQINRHLKMPRCSYGNRLRVGM